jgi:hypothetical protein
MKIKRKILLLPVALIIAVVIFAGVLKAQTQTPGLTVHPTNLDISSDTKQSSTGTLYLKNNTKQTVSIITELRNFTASGDQGGVEITSENTPFSLASWMKISPEKATLAPNEESKFTYTINPPANAEPGGHYGSVLFKTVPGTNTSGVGAALSQEIASLFLVRIPGNVVEKATIESFTPNKNFFENGPVDFTLKVKNEGGVHVKPAGVVTLTNTFGQKSNFSFEGSNVFPGAIRQMLVSWNDKNSNFLIGKYKAHLDLAYGSKSTQLFADTEFYAFPVKLGLIILVVVIVLFFLRKRLWKAFSVILKGK